MDKFPLGWIDFDVRTNEQNDAHDAVLGAMPKFAMPKAGKPEVGFKILLPDIWKHPTVIQKLGYAYTGCHQITGSCVWAGMQDVVTTINFLEVLMHGEQEQLLIPFVLSCYGRSRLYAGMRGRGEGSLGSTMAKAVTFDGVPNGLAANVPGFSRTDGFIWGRETELAFSDGAKIPADIAAEGSKHLIKTTTPLYTGEDVRDAILNLYPVTRAFSTFVNPGSAKVKDGALVGKYNGRGGHQESWSGYWNHPTLGELIWEQNQWGLDTYGTDPGGGPAGGCWISLDDVHKQCQSRYAEIYAVSQYDGYPSQTFRWGTMGLV